MKKDIEGNKKIVIKGKRTIKSALSLFKNASRIVEDKLTSYTLNKNGIEVGSINELYEKLYINPMTGAYNKEFLYDKISQEFIKADEKNIQVCVGFMDADNVKYINDNYGHNMGDKEITHLVSIFTEKFSEGNNKVKPSQLDNDVKFIRVSGDEFIVVVYRKGSEWLIEKIKEVKKSIFDEGLRRKKLNLDQQNNDRGKSQVGPPLSFTSAIVMRKKGETVEEIIERLDKILNNAKQFDRGSIYFENDKVVTNNLLNDKKKIEISDIINLNRGKDNFFAICKYDYLEGAIDRRNKLSTHTISSIKFMEQLIKSSMPKCINITKLDNNKSIMIFRNCSREDFDKLKNFINNIIRSDNDLRDKVLYAIGGQEMLEKYSYEEIINSVEYKIKIAHDTGQEIVIDRRLMV